MIFQYSPYFIPSVKDQNSFYEIRSLAIYINIKSFNRDNTKQLNILKMFLEYLEFYNIAYWGWFSPKVALKIHSEG